MCNAVVESVGSSKIVENNCSDESNLYIIMDSEVIEGTTSLSLNGRSISNITGIEHFTNLTNIYLSNNQISELAPLSGLTSLTSLTLYENQISDLTPLKDLTSLTNLDLHNNQITDLSPLAALIRLHRLNVAANPLLDITPILHFNIEGVPVLGDAPPYAISYDIANSKEYALPSLFQFFNATLDVTPVAQWVTVGQEMIRQMKDADMIKFELQNATMSEDGKGITILDTNEPAMIDVYATEDGEEFFLAASLTVTYEEPVDPDDPVSPTDPTDDPAVPDTGKNTKESSTAALTATLCILSGIILTAIPMTRIYRKTREQ